MRTWNERMEKKKHRPETFTSIGSLVTYCLGVCIYDQRRVSLQLSHMFSIVRRQFLGSYNQREVLTDKYTLVLRFSSASSFKDLFFLLLYLYVSFFLSIIG